MNSFIDLRPKSKSVTRYPVTEIPKFCSLLMPSADQTELIAFDEGRMLKQSFKHYSALIELFEVELSKDTSIQLKVEQPAFFMFIIMNGHSTFTDVMGKVLSETSGNNCLLAHMKAGTYWRNMAAGKHKLLMITFNEDWFLRKIDCLDPLRPLLQYQVAKTLYQLLPHCALASCLFTSFEKLNTRINTRNHPEMDMTLLTFVNECVNSYNDKLIQNQFDVQALHRKKADEIAEFVRENFTDKIVDDEASLARKFMVSEKTLVRMAKLAFNRPLHKQVIELRMLYALKALLVTKKPINEIAASMGYTDPYYFSRAFKNRFGISPNKIR